MFAIPAQKILTHESLKKLQSIVQEIDESEELERQYIQTRVDQKFSHEEQSILWQCMNDKNSGSIHNVLNPIVRKHMSSDAPANLYRGVSRIELSKLELLEEGEIFTLDRVTSFSTDLEQARQFASEYSYASFAILNLQNTPFAYNYYQDILDIVLGAPDCEFGNRYAPANEDRMEKLDMIESEQEFMLPAEASFKLVGFDMYKKDNNDNLFTVYRIELLNW